jgi:hypothetical protein
MEQAVKARLDSTASNNRNLPLTLGKTKQLRTRLGLTTSRIWDCLGSSQVTIGPRKQLQLTQEAFEDCDQLVASKVAKPQQEELQHRNYSGRATWSQTPERVLKTGGRESLAR